MAADNHVRRSPPPSSSPTLSLSSSDRLLFHSSVQLWQCLQGEDGEGEGGGLSFLLPTVVASDREGEERGGEEGKTHLLLKKKEKGEEEEKKLPRLFPGEKKRKRKHLLPFLSLFLPFLSLCLPFRSSVTLMWQRPFPLLQRRVSS